MIRFILGEDRHVQYFVHSTETDTFRILSANYELRLSGKIEASGTCTIEAVAGGNNIDMKLQPKQRSDRYELEITLAVADEIIKHREPMEVV